MSGDGAALRAGLPGWGGIDGASVKCRIDNAPLVAGLSWTGLGLGLGLAYDVPGPGAKFLNILQIREPRDGYPEREPDRREAGRCFTVTMPTSGK